MKKTYVAVTAGVSIVIVLLSGLLLTNYDFSATNENPHAYVGIAYCGDTVDQGKQLIDKVKDYTNLFVLQSGLLQRDLKSVDELGDYAVDAGMYFLPYFGVFIQDSFSGWLESAKEKWGDRFLGVYYGDEPGGKMLDHYVEYDDELTGDSITKTKYGDIVVQKPNGIVINYQFDGNIRLSEPAPASTDSDINSEALFRADGSIETIRAAPNGFSYQTYQQLQDIRPFKDINETAQRFCNRDKANIDFLKNSTKVFTSDYALYWFDYLAGYDVVLGQLGWNLSATQQLSFLRGAANTQQKDWGVVITWKYQSQSPPYLDSGSEVLSQLKTAYQCGAKYFVIFNYYGEDAGAYGTMQDEHFQALNSFWKDVVENPVQESVKADSALIFPKNFGWGARWAEDKIWGIFKADDGTNRIWDLMQQTLEEKGLDVDVIFDDPKFPLSASYQKVHYAYG